MTIYNKAHILIVNDTKGEISPMLDLTCKYINPVAHGKPEENVLRGFIYMKYGYINMLNVITDEIYHVDYYLSCHLYGEILKICNITAAF